MKPALLRYLAKPFAYTGACLLLAQHLAAHETWLLPESFEPRADSGVTLYMTSGMAFPRFDSGISASRIVEAVLSQNGRRDLLVPKDTRAGALELLATTEVGTACAWVALSPRILEIKPDAVAHYLKEIGAGDDVWAAWEAQGEPKYWKESYSKLARTYLHSGKDEAANPAGTRDTTPCWADQSSSRFEILPLADPSALKEGDKLMLQLLFDGKPLINQAVGLMKEGDEPNALEMSDANGRLNLSVDEAGRYMVYATHLRPQMGDGFNWESNFVTLTLQVGDES